MFSTRLPSLPLVAIAFLCSASIIATAQTPDDPEQAGRFAGTVLGPDGEPLMGAEIRVVSSKGNATDAGPVRARTDGNGHFEFDAPDLTYRGYDGLPKRREAYVIASAAGLAPEWMKTWGHNTSGFREYWTPRKDAQVELQLARDDVPLRGRLLDADGQPLEGARVRLTRLMVPRDRDLDAHLDRWSKASVHAGFLTKAPDYNRELNRPELLPAVQTETRADADGWFELRGLGCDRLARIEITDPRAVDTSIEGMTREGDNVGTFIGFDKKPTRTTYGAGFSLTVERGLTVSGVVRDRDTQQPVAGMWVTRRYNPLTHPHLTRDVVVSDADGRFTITGLDPKLLDYKERARQWTAIPQPGVQYLQARGVVNKDAELLIECTRGVPFQLQLVNDDGEPVEGRVEYRIVRPNPHVEDLVRPLAGSRWPVMNRAVRRPDGTYEGFVLPGPGAILVEMPSRSSYRPALVDPKAFFEPDRQDWPEQADQLYGTRDTLEAVGGRIDQHKWNAIVLVNPEKPNGAHQPLKLKAIVHRDQPREVRLVDANGNPVTGVDSRMRWPGRETKEILRSSTFFVRGLHPQRIKKMTFFKDDRQLIGELEASADGDTPYTVVLKRWSTITGRIVDDKQQPVRSLRVVLDGGSRSAKTDRGGRFRIDKLIPGRKYRANVYRKGRQSRGLAFENVTLKPGEVRDLGDVPLGKAASRGPRNPQPDAAEYLPQRTLFERLSKSEEATLADDSLSAAAKEHLQSLLTLEAKGVDRLAYFSDFLDHDDPHIAGNAHLEFALASQADFAQFSRGLTPRYVRQLIVKDNPGYRTRLYLAMLAACGDASDGDWLEPQLAGQYGHRALESWIAAYLSLTGEAGLKYVRREYLGNEEAGIGETYTALLALRCVRDHPSISHKSQAQAVRLVLRNPLMQDLAINGLAYHRDWSSIDRVVALARAANDRATTRAAVNYLRLCPRAAAKEKLNELQHDPAFANMIKRATSFYPASWITAQQQRPARPIRPTERGGGGC